MLVICSFLLFHLFNLDVLLIMYQFCKLCFCRIVVSRCVATVRSSMYFGMRPKLEDGARKLKTSMISIPIFNSFQFVRHYLGGLTKKSERTSSQYW